MAASYHSGWQATVDGRPVPVLRVNRDFLGCVVEAGRHRLTLDFQVISNPVQAEHAGWKPTDGAAWIVVHAFDIGLDKNRLAIALKFQGRQMILH